MLKDLDIKTVLMTAKKPQSNALVDRMHQVILNMLVTKDLANKIFKYIDPWVETLSSMAYGIRASYHRTIQAIPGQYVFGRYMAFNLTSVADCRVITTGKHRQVEIENTQEKYRQVTHDYAIGDLV